MPERADGVAVHRSIDRYITCPKPEFYRQLNASLAALLDGERDWIANLANAAALLYHTLPEINWAGFYLLPERFGESWCWDRFRGSPPACELGIGKGVCGTAALARETQVVAGRSRLPRPHRLRRRQPLGNCGAAVRLESEVIGVLDIDSPVAGAL